MRRGADSVWQSTELTADMPGSAADRAILRRGRLDVLMARPSVDGADSSGLERVCRTAVDALGLTAAVVSLMAPSDHGDVGSEAIAASWGPEARKVEELQLSLGEGPSRDAFVLRRPVLTADLEHHLLRWPGYAPVAIRAGIASVSAFPLAVGAVRLGVLTLYDAVAKTMHEDHLADSLILCEIAKRLLLDDALGGFNADASVLEQLEFRDAVYQAQGMTMVALGVSLGDALARMRARAFATDQDLTTLAEDIISGQTTFSDADRDG